MVKKILVIRGGALGDFLVTLPALKLLRDRWPDSNIELLGHPRIAVLGVDRFYLNATRSIDRGPLANFFIPQGVLDPDWQDYFGTFDLIVSYFFDPDDLFQNNLRRCTDGDILCSSPQVSTAPAARHFCRALNLLGLSTNDFTSRVDLQPADHEAARLWLDSFSGSLLGVHPGSGSESKNWPLGHWMEWLTVVCPKHNLTPLIFTGEADEARRRACRVGLKIKSLWADQLELPLVAALLHRCRAYVGHDTGMTHLAAAAGCPTLALFGPTDPQIWAPPHPHVRILQRDPPMEQLSVNEVAAALEKMLV